MQTKNNKIARLFSLIMLCYFKICIQVAFIFLGKKVNIAKKNIRILTVVYYNNHKSEFILIPTPPFIKCMQKMDTYDNRN